MTDFSTLSEVKEHFIEALTTLPEQTILVSGESNSTFTEINLSETVSQDIQRLQNLWEFLESYRNLKIIALVGMVNTGKSALGNHLLHCGESGIFEEACIRETSEAQEAKIDEETIVIDLPGLGAVLCDEDDKVVRGIIRRANLLLLVLDINYPIPRHLYDFLKSDEVIKSGGLQRIIIVVNKIDSLQDLPEKVQKKQIQKYINFLTNGNSQMEFEGISKLFDYEIPIVPFSVKQARENTNSALEYELQRVINLSLEASSNTAIYRAEYDLLQIAANYVLILIGYATIQEKKEDLDRRMTSSIKAVRSEINDSLQREIQRFAERIISIRDSCYKEMSNSYTTTSAERFWQGDNFQWKKERINKCRERYKEQMVSEFNQFSRNLRTNVSIIARSLFGDVQISVPNGDSITSELKSSIYEIWDAFDDYWFLDKDSYTFNRSLDQSTNCLNKAVDYLKDWLSELDDRISDTLRSKINNMTLFQEYSYYLSHAQLLESFCQKFVSIDYLRDIFLNQQ
ncbi:50S ribosome-binding GTPase [Roseofilum sp. BLCC_M154]|uniref:50S ribosome-binding GTPase n=1 Tax=Roseofilum acuticapitatum BLCC-M154 TaxID=3022444 RepID=A0ABT7AYY4_9CYAN|nr:GTPase [Roseofilum acuticapitatum]MDJ1172123.1 50S ribosome-binding GTPase [Roseofilum acuticapitatum BLCC-M154]